MLMNQGAGKVLSSSVPKSQLTMVDGLVARYLRDTTVFFNTQTIRSAHFLTTLKKDICGIRGGFYSGRRILAWSEEVGRAHTGDLVISSQVFVDHPHLQRRAIGSLKLS